MLPALKGKKQQGIALVFVAPTIYSFFVDNYDKDKPKIKS